MFQQRTSQVRLCCPLAEWAAGAGHLAQGLGRRHWKPSDVAWSRGGWRAAYHDQPGEELSRACFVLLERDEVGSRRQTAAQV